MDRVFGVSSRKVGSRYIELANISKIISKVSGLSEGKNRNLKKEDSLAIKMKSFIS